MCSDKKALVHLGKQASLVCLSSCPQAQAKNLIAKREIIVLLLALPGHGLTTPNVCHCIVVTNVTKEVSVDSVLTLQV